MDNDELKKIITRFEKIEANIGMTGCTDDETLMEFLKKKDIETVQRIQSLEKEQHSHPSDLASKAVLERIEKLECSENDKIKDMVEIIKFLKSMGFKHDYKYPSEEKKPPKELYPNKNNCEKLGHSYLSSCQRCGKVEKPKDSKPEYNTQLEWAYALHEENKKLREAEKEIKRLKSKDNMKIIEKALEQFIVDEQTTLKCSTKKLWLILKGVEFGEEKS